jgi:hypothetical protein
MHGAHQGQVDHQVSIANGVPGDVVAAATNCHAQTIFGGKSDGAHDIGCAATARYHAGSAIDHRVPDAPRFVKRRIIWCEDIAGEAVAELVELKVGGWHGGLLSFHAQHVRPVNGNFGVANATNKGHI